MSIRIVLIIACLLPIASAHVRAQEIPTPAPSKTPTVVPGDGTDLLVDQSASEKYQADALPLSQGDLSILTGNIQRPNGLVWHDDVLFTSCSGDWTLYRIDPATGMTSQYIYGVKNANSLFAETVDSGVSLWIPDFQSNSLVNIQQGVIRNVASDLGGPWGIAALDERYLAITSLKGNSLLVISRTGETIVEAITDLKSPAGVVKFDNYVLIANTGSARRAIEYYFLDDLLNGETPLDSAVNQSSLVTGLQNVTGLTIGNEGALYFNYSLGTRGVVGRVSAQECMKQGGCSAEDVEIVIYTELAAPLAGLTIAPDNTLYIHSIFSPDIFYARIPEMALSQ